MPQLCILGKPGTPSTRATYWTSPVFGQKSDPVAEHFYTNGHEVAYFSVMGFEKLNGSAIYRKTMEQDKLGA